ncbi:carboxymuconolactone decarboxylase family protein, partial [Oceanidesulfovibrio marinus]|uniref:carboxymuconolactone decarboxylase family protein n=1 Tax=Oceanidesulfovibrio marinus TaxID=370038 RepID=UPI001ABFB4ED
PASPAERYPRLLANLGRVDGHGGWDVLAAVKAISPHLAQYLLKFPFGDVYSRPGLVLREREVSSITALSTQSAWTQFKVHVSAGLRAGLKRNEILAIVIPPAVYCGFPHGPQRPVRRQARSSTIWKTASNALLQLFTERQRSPRVRRPGLATITAVVLVLELCSEAWSDEPAYAAV